MNLAREKFQTANHVRIYTRGRTEELGLGRLSPGGGALGEATAADLSSDGGARHLHVIGDAEPVDIVDSAHSYSLTLSTLKPRDAAAAEILKNERVVIELLDRYNGQVVATAEECQLVSGRISVAANAPVSRNLTFACMRIH